MFVIKLEVLPNRTILSLLAVLLSVTVVTIVSGNSNNNVGHHNNCGQNSQLVYPCGCQTSDSGGGHQISVVNCSRIPMLTANDLIQLSRRLADNQLAVPDGGGGGYTIDQLMIAATGLQKLTSTVFARTAFRRIVIADNPMLDSIDSRSLNGSRDTCQQLTIRANPRLFEFELAEQDFWSLVKKFGKLEELRVTGTALATVPAQAFEIIHHDQRWPHLKLLDLSHNRIHRLGDRAFYDLTHSSLQLILNNNRLTRIGGQVFKFRPPLLPPLASDSPIIRSIDLSANNLTDESFTRETFGRIGRPVATLMLNQNRLQTLTEQVFRPLFVQSDKSFFELEVADNPIQCRDNCPLQWIYQTRYCSPGRQPVSVDRQIVSLRCRISDFQDSNCPAMGVQWTDSCLGSGGGRGIGGSHQSLANRLNNSYSILMKVIINQIMFAILPIIYQSLIAN